MIHNNAVNSGEAFVSNANEMFAGYGWRKPYSGRKRPFPQPQ